MRVGATYRVVGTVSRTVVLGLGTAPVRPVGPVMFGPVRGGGGPPGRGEQRHVQGDGQRVSRVVHGRDGCNSIHGPIEAQSSRVDEQPDVLDG